MRTLVAVILFSLAVIAEAESPVPESDGGRRLSKAWQLQGFVISDPDLVGRPWTKYSGVGGNRAAFLKLSNEAQFSVLAMQFEDLSALIAPNRDEQCSVFFELPPAHRPVTWGSRELAKSVALGLSGDITLDDWVSRGLKIQQHRKAEIRPFMKEAVRLSEVFDKLCFDSDSELTVLEVGKMMALSPEATSEPEWVLDKEFMSRWAADMGFN